MLGVAILSMSAVLVKMIGVCFKIPLVHLLGTEGMGYFNAAYDVYALLCLTSTTGLPVAVSVMINKKSAWQKAIFRVSLLAFSSMGILWSVAVFVLADPIARAIGAPLAAGSLRTIAPALLFICLTSALRGYFQGKGNMQPTAVSQVIEAMGKLVLGLLLSYVAVRLGLPLYKAAACAVLGLSGATMLSTVYLFLVYRKNTPPPDPEPSRYTTLAGELARVAFPVTMSAALTGLSKMLDLGLIMRRLQDCGMAEQTAVSLYGAYSAMAVPLFGAVPALFGSLAMSLIPHLTSAIVQKDTKQQASILSLSFRLTALVSVPSAIGMAMLSDRILALLYGAQAEQTPSAVPMLIILCMAVPASCMLTTTNAVLQSYGKQWIPMLAMGVGCAIKAVTVYVLTAVPQIGILAAPLGTLLCCIIAVVINMAAVARTAPVKGWSHSWLWAMAVSAVSIGLAAAVKRMWLSTASIPVSVGLTVIIAVIIFVPLAFAAGLVKKDDIKSIK